MLKTDSGQTSDGYTNRQHGSCVWINLLRSMYRDFLRYFESRFQSHEGIFLREMPISPACRKGSTESKTGCARPSQKSVSDRGPGKAPIRILISFAPVCSQITSPASRQTPHKYNEIYDYGKSIFRFPLPDTSPSEISRRHSSVIAKETRKAIHQLRIDAVTGFPCWF